MGKVAVIAFVAFSLSGAYYTLNRNQQTLATSARVSDHQYEVLAREAALDGTSIGRQSLADSFAPTTFNGESPGATFTTSITVSGNHATIKSTGQATDASGNPSQYEVVTEVVRRVVLPPTGPSWMEYAVISDGDLTLKGDIDAIVVSGTNSNELNADIHTNGTLTVTGNSVDVKGFGTYHTGVSGNPAHVEGAFDPHYNPTELDGHYQTAYVDIPDFDMTEILAAVGPDGAPLVDQVEAASLSLSGVYNFGSSRENPHVVHVQGDLSVTGSSSFTGYVMYIVDGNVDFTGDFTNVDSGYDGAEESSMAIYAAGDVSMHGTVNIDAQIFAGGEVTTSAGTPTITGSIVTKTIVDLKGTPNIVYRPPSSSLTTPWQDLGLLIDLIGYYER